MISGTLYVGSVSGAGSYSLGGSGNGSGFLSAAYVNLSGPGESGGTLTQLSGAAAISGSIFNNFYDPATLTINGSSSTTYGGSISGGTLALVKLGTGTLVLSGSNKWTGGTTVSSGALVLDGAASPLAGASLTIGSTADSGGGIVVPNAVSSPQGAPSLVPVPVPVPGTLVPLFVGVLGVLAMYRKRHRLA